MTITNKKVSLGTKTIEKIAFWLENKTNGNSTKGKIIMILLHILAFAPFSICMYLAHYVSDYPSSLSTMVGYGISLVIMFPTIFFGTGIIESYNKKMKFDYTSLKTKKPLSFTLWFIFNFKTIDVLRYALFIVTILVMYALLYDFASKMNFVYTYLGFFLLLTIISSIKIFINRKYIREHYQYYKENFKTEGYGTN